MKYTIKERKELPESEVRLILEIPTEEVAVHRSHVLAEAVKDAELPGFRKGHVPPEMIRSRLGEMRLWEEAATDALSHALTEVFRVEKLDVIGRPHVEATKMAPDNPVEFRITLSLYPTLSLPDYKKIAAEENKKPEESEKITDKEMEEVIAEIKKDHEKTTGKNAFVLTDESVKEIGKFENLADFRTKISEGLSVHKRERAKEKRRAALLDRLTQKCVGSLPRVLIDSELARMESELQAQIERMGGSFDGYLAEIKKDRETVRKEWRPDAERRARLQLMLLQIARAENITAPKEAVETEVKHILEQYKDASEENARGYIETVLTNKKVIEFLESQK